MLRVGLTGGIGSGKSTVAAIFEVLGVPVYYADAESKRLMNEDEKLREQIITHFGNESYDSDGLRRSHLASVVFNDPVKLSLLNSFVHPATIAAAEKWMQQLSKPGEHDARGIKSLPYAIKEAALIFESNAHKMLDYVIGISSPESLRLSRAMNRDHVSEEEIRSRMSRQMDEAEKISRCDFIIVNDEMNLLIPQVLKVHQELLELSKPSREVEKLG